MRRNRAVRSQRERHLWLNPASPSRQVFDHGVEILAIQPRIGKVQHLAMADLQNLAGGGKFGAPHGRKFVVGPGSAAIGGRLAWGEAEDVSFDSSAGIAQQGPAKATRFIVRMSSNAEQSQHSLSGKKVW